MTVLGNRLRLGHGRSVPAVRGLRRRSLFLACLVGLASLLAVSCASGGGSGTGAGSGSAAGAGAGAGASGARAAGGAAPTSGQLPSMPAGGFGPCDNHPAMAELFGRAFPQGVPAAALTCNTYPATAGKYEGTLALEAESAGAIAGTPVQGRITTAVRSDLRFEVDGMSSVQGQSPTTTETNFTFEGTVGPGMVQGQNSGQPMTADVGMAGRAELHGNLVGHFPGASGPRQAMWEGGAFGVTRRGAAAGTTENQPYSLRLRIERISCDEIAGTITDDEIQQMYAPYAQIGLTTTVRSRSWSALYNHWC